MAMTIPQRRIAGIRGGGVKKKIVGGEPGVRDDVHRGCVGFTRITRWMQIWIEYLGITLYAAFLLSCPLPLSVPPRLVVEGLEEGTSGVGCPCSPPHVNFLHLSKGMVQWCSSFHY